MNEIIKIQSGYEYRLVSDIDCDGEEVEILTGESEKVKGKYKVK